MYRIRSFGNDRECGSIDELQRTLTQTYQGQSVAVSYRAGSTGMLRTVFIDVREDGELTASYGAQERIDLNTLATAN